ncbi:MAG: L,D-transpeptidase family protein [Burkholderiaceae bacterium]
MLGPACRAAVFVGAWLCGALAWAQAGDRAERWFDGARPRPLAQQALQLLAEAPGHGLDARDYALDALGSGFARAARGAPLGVDERVALGARLDAALRRYLHDLHRGRIDPRTLHPRYAIAPREHFDADELLNEALARGDPGAAVRRAVPQVPQYERLREALARARALAAHPAWGDRLPELPRAARPAHAGKLEPGQAWPGLPLLQQRLQAMGDLPASDARAAPPAYDGGLVAAVRAFQQRHGLAADGVIGASTWRALQVAPSLRARQIELALERLRWTPLLTHARTIVINIPEFVLRAYEVHDGRIEVQRTMKVVVGKALDTRTPLIEAELRYIECSPFWNVPPSIARAEVVPLLLRQSAVWARDGYEFVDARGAVDAAYSRAKLDAVLAGQLRIRQRPGPRNPLGDIKFVFPNDEQIYLHHTPATRLFERERRDFSHGCIRVEQPVELATFVLRGMPAWSESRIRQAMDHGTSATLAVTQPVHVLIAYATALVKDGRVHFFDDLYGLDAMLDAALQRESARRAAAAS